MPEVKFSLNWMRDDTKKLIESTNHGLDKINLDNLINKLTVQKIEYARTLLKHLLNKDTATCSRVDIDLCEKIKEMDGIPA